MTSDALYAILPIMKMSKNAIHHFGMPRIMHENTPVRTTIMNMGFLHPFLSESEPSAGPTNSITTVTKVTAAAQYERYSVSTNPPSAAISWK